MSSGINEHTGETFLTFLLTFSSFLSEFRVESLFHKIILAENQIKLIRIGLIFLKMCYHKLEKLVKLVKTVRGEKIALV